MVVDEKLWLQAMTADYARKYLMYRGTTTGIFTSSNASQVVTESFWVERSLYKLGKLPGKDVKKAVSLLLKGFQSLPAHAEESKKIGHMRELGERLRGTGPSGDLAAVCLLACL